VYRRRFGWRSRPIATLALACSQVTIADLPRGGTSPWYKPRMLVPGKEGATLPFTPALSAPADDASFLRGVLEAIPALGGDSDGRRDCIVVALDVTSHVARERVLDSASNSSTRSRPRPGHLLTHAYGTARNFWRKRIDRVEWMSRFCTNEGESKCEQ
jgi:hypothetical protein